MPNPFQNIKKNSIDKKIAMIAVMAVIILAGFWLAKPSVTKATFTLTDGAGKTINVHNNLTIGNGTSTTAVTAATNNPILNISGNFMIRASSTFTASPNSSLSIGGNWSNAGTFSANSGTTTFSGTGSQTLSGVMIGSSTFYNLVITNASSTAGIIFSDSASSTIKFTAITPNSRITFTTGKTYTFASINIGGTSGQNVVLTSNNAVPGTPAGPQWNFIVPQASPSVSYVTVYDSNASGGNDIIAYGGTNTNGGNNTDWLFDAPTSAFDLSGYRWFQNSDTTAPGTVFSDKNASSTLTATGQAFRLRMLIHVSSADLSASTTAFKLQYAQKVGTVCDTDMGATDESYADVTTGTAISYKNNSPYDGALATASTTADPTHSSDTIVMQTYRESNNFISTSTITAGQDGLWDFALYDNGAATGTSYCFRAVESDSSLLNTYSYVPEIKMFTPPPSFSVMGSIYQTGSESTLDTTGYTVAMSINNGTASTTTASAGSFSFNGATSTAGASIAVYLQGHANDANTFTVTDSTTSIANLNLFVGKVAVGNNNSNGTTTNANICNQATYPGAGDKLISCSGNNLTIATSSEFHILTARKYDTGSSATLTTQGIGGSLHVDDNASTTLTTSSSSISDAVSIDTGAGLIIISTNTLNVGGNWTNSGSFIYSSSTINFNGSSTQQVNLSANWNSNSFYNLIHSGSGTFKLVNEAMYVKGDFQLTGGTFDSNLIGQNYYGNFSLSNGTTYVNYSSINFSPIGTKTIIDSNTIKQNLGSMSISNGSATPTINLGSSIVAANVSIYSGKTLNLGSSGYTLTLTGEGANFSRPLNIDNGTFNAGTNSTVKFTGGGSLTEIEASSSVGSITYNNLEISASSTGGNFRLGTANSQTINISGNLTINDGSGTETQTVDWDTYDPIVNIAGNLTINNYTTWTKSDTATTTFNGTASPVAWTDNNVTKQNIGNVVIGNGTDAKTVNLGSIVKATNITILYNATLNNGAANKYNINVGGNWANSGTFTSNSGGYIIFDGSSLQTASGTMTGSSAFYNLQVKNASTTTGVYFLDSASTTGTFIATTSSSRIKFKTGKTYTFSNINITGTTTPNIVLTSDNAVPGTPAGPQWNLIVPQASPSVFYVTVYDSNATGGSQINAYDGTNTNGDNNTHWLFDLSSITHELAGYRWLNNTDSTSTSAVLAGKNASATLTSTGQAFRLRMLLHIGAGDLTAGALSYKLQYAPKVGGTCDTDMGATDESYADVTGATAISYKNNSPSDGDLATASTTADPTHNADTVVIQSYEESNNFTSTSTIVSGQDGLWDFALYDNGATASTSYCFRAVKSDSNFFDTYTYVPQITTYDPPLPIALSQSGYRWFNNPNSLVPLYFLGDANNGADLSTTSQAFRLRLLIHTANQDLTAGAQDFKLKFALKGADCASASYSDVTNSTAIAYKDNGSLGDGDTMTASSTADPTHSGHTNIVQTYEEANDFTSISTITAGQDGIWDFSLYDYTATASSTYCFKVTKSDNSDLGSYGNYPEITAYNPPVVPAATTTIDKYFMEGVTNFEGIINFE